MSLKQLKRIPAIFTDVDGVLIRGSRSISNSNTLIPFLNRPLHQIFPDITPQSVNQNTKFPFFCITNGGGVTESVKAYQLNKKLGISEREPYALTGHNFFVNFSSMRPKMAEYSNKNVLICGMFECDKVAEDAGVNKHISIEEICTIYPYLVPLSFRKWEDRHPTLDIVSKRLGISSTELEQEPLQIHAIMILNDSIKWDEGTQVILDYLTTNDGTIAKQNSDTIPDDHIPIYVANNDATWAEHFRLQRQGNGSFNTALKALYKYHYKKELHMNIYGKPEKVAFEYARARAVDSTDMPISNFYMIGDNPKADIRGGNCADFITILVRTGIFSGLVNDPTDPAKYVVDNFQEAIKLIFDLEGLPLDINLK